VDPLSPEGVEQLRRSIAMLHPEATATLKRADALRLLGELQRLQGLLKQATRRLRITLASLEQ